MENQSIAPHGYVCPVCIGISRKHSDETWILPHDFVHVDNLVSAFISSKFIKGNEGHILVVPNDHFESIYDIPIRILSRVSHVSQVIAKVMKDLYECDGINCYQNNESAGDQHAFHYHMHIIPRYQGDDFHRQWWRAEKADGIDRAGYASTVREYLNKNRDIFLPLE